MCKKALLIHFTKHKNMIVGYARVSTIEQNLDLQINDLKKFECELIFQEKESGAKKARPELDNMLKYVRSGDTIVVWKLDRLGRSTKNLIELIETFKERNIDFKSIIDGFNTSTITGKMMFTIFAALAEYERNLIRERTIAGLAAARARGRFGGRPKGITPENQRKAHTALMLYVKNEMSTEQIKETLKISRSTLYKYIRFANGGTLPSPNLKQINMRS